MELEQVIGVIPAEATHFRCYRVSEGRREPLFIRDSGVEVSTIPVSELSLEKLRSRWGAGRYVVRFCREEPGKGWRLCGGGRPFGLAAVGPSSGVSSESSGAESGNDGGSDATHKGPAVSNTAVLRANETRADAVSERSSPRFGLETGSRESPGFDLQKILEIGSIVLPVLQGAVEWWDGRRRAEADARRLEVEQSMARERQYNEQRLAQMRQDHEMAMAQNREFYERLRELDLRESEGDDEPDDSARTKSAIETALAAVPPVVAALKNGGI